MYLDNKYTKWYYSIINNARSRGWTKKTATTYVERHHIIPRCMNGINDKINLVYLSAKEHFICHLLLTKMTTGQIQYKMRRAIDMMLCVNEKNQDRYYPSSRVYAKIRKDSIVYGKDHFNYGRKRSDEWKEYRSSQYTGEGNPSFGKRWKNKTFNGNNSEENNPMYGRNHKESSILLQVLAAKNRDKKTCPHCGKTMDVSNFARWGHEDGSCVLRMKSVSKLEGST
jgi:hypothetical protein